VIFVDECGENAYWVDSIVDMKIIGEARNR